MFCPVFLLSCFCLCWLRADVSTCVSCSVFYLSVIFMYHGRGRSLPAATRWKAVLDFSPFISFSGVCLSLLYACAFVRMTVLVQNCHDEQLVR